MIYDYYPIPDGGWCIGGAIYGLDNSIITVTSSNITHNKATHGGAIGGYNISIIVTNSNLNYNERTGLWGGVIF